MCLQLGCQSSTKYAQRLLCKVCFWVVCLLKAAPKATRLLCPTPPRHISKKKRESLHFDYPISCRRNSDKELLIRFPGWQQKYVCFIVGKKTNLQASTKKPSTDVFSLVAWNYKYKNLDCLVLMLLPRKKSSTSMLALIRIFIVLFSTLAKY